MTSVPFLGLFSGLRACIKAVKAVEMVHATGRAAGLHLERRLACAARLRRHAVKLAFVGVTIFPLFSLGTGGDSLGDDTPPEEGWGISLPPRPPGGPLLV